MTRYPNLLELHKYHPYGEPAMCDHAGIEPELLHAVLDSGALLEPGEVDGLSRLYGYPASVLACPKRIMLDMNRRRHISMAAEVWGIHSRLEHKAVIEGNADAAKYLKAEEWRFQRFLEAVKYNRLSYCHCLGAKERFSQLVSFAKPKPKRRGLQA